MGSAREAAMLTLTACDKQGAWSEGHLKRILKESALDRRDAALATRLCFGVLQTRMALDWYLERRCTGGLKKLEPKVLSILRLSLYQVLYMDKIPPSAAVNEGVQLTKKHCRNPRAAGMVNGVLRGILRDMPLPPPQGKDELETIPGLVPQDQVEYAPLYRNPKRIFGIGLNYAEHAGDIGNAPPQGFPGSFFKMADTLIGPGDEIQLPTLKEAQKTTAEAELGIIMGRDCRDVAQEDWQSAIVGYTTILDMTEESILKGNDYLSGNPRYLCIVKNFPTFFSFGPQLVTPDEVPDVLKLEVQSVHNGEIHAKNTVDHMTHTPDRLVSLHSQIQGWYAGDILATGTPRAFHIQDGDVAECRIVGPDGFAMEPLVNPVVDLKKHPEKA